MNGSRETGSVRWLGPVIVWLLLLVLLGVSCASAFVPMGALNTAVNLAVAAVMLLLLGSFLMKFHEHERVATARGSVRIALDHLLVHVDLRRLLVAILSAVDAPEILFAVVLITALACPPGFWRPETERAQGNCDSQFA